MTCDMWHNEGDEHSPKISNPYLIRFGSEGVLKIFEQKGDQPTELFN